LKLVDERKREKIRLAVSARETDIVACIEKMAAPPIPPVYSGHLFFLICASLPIQGFNYMFSEKYIFS